MHGFLSCCLPCHSFRKIGSTKQSVYTQGHLLFSLTASKSRKNYFCVSNLCYLHPKEKPLAYPRAKVGWIALPRESDLRPAPGMGTAVQSRVESADIFTIYNGLLTQQWEYYRQVNVGTGCISWYTSSLQYPDSRPSQASSEVSIGSFEDAPSPQFFFCSKMIRACGACYVEKTGFKIMKPEPQALLLHRGSNIYLSLQAACLDRESNTHIWNSLSTILPGSLTKELRESL